MAASTLDVTRSDPINIVLLYPQLGLVSTTARLIGEARLLVDTGQVMLHKHDAVEVIIPLPGHQTERIKARVIESNRDEATLHLFECPETVIEQVLSLPQRREESAAPVC